MQHNRLTLPDSLRHALLHVLEHYYADERNDYRLCPPHERSLKHIYHWLRILRVELRRQRKPLDIDALLAANRQVAVIWHIEDVLSIRPELSEEQAWDVLFQCKRVHDCCYGFTWDLIETVADDLYPSTRNDQTEDAK